MKLLLIRHAEAEEREVGSNKDDALRPLTEAGRKRFRKAAAGLKRIEPSLGSIGTSPLVRAIETAALIAKEYGIEAKELAALAPGGKGAAVVRWLQGLDEGATVALVGHEPDLGHLASWLLTRSAGKSFIQFKKGEVMTLEFPERVVEGKALLRWAMTQGQLRQIKK